MFVIVRFTVVRPAIVTFGVTTWATSMPSAPCWTEVTCPGTVAAAKTKLTCSGSVKYLPVRVMISPPLEEPELGTTL